ncbi:hypothetical protein HUN92_13760 [Bacillus firmus]|uniref:hypothetical protein n=1 Tax=Cytobacillus firmus TaxID=1399 RepID=UPI0015801C46|nr:hypothetical protein [Cytobacillus firmus]NUH84786.1 hypothetical protein [Cytobacillus firmus]
MKVYFYRGMSIMTNPIENGFKWTVFEIDDIFSNSLDDIKNQIDKHLGGFATSRIPKRNKTRKELSND